MTELERFIGTSLESFEEAAVNAFAEFEGDPSREGLAAAKVHMMWVEKGGFVGRIQYHVELEPMANPE
jgi:flavin-binding protein dodecin